MSERILSYGEAINEALIVKMTQDPTIVCLGIDVSDPKRINGTTNGLPEKFGKDRCFSTPLAEEGMTGAAIGMALGGLRPVMTHIRMDFTLLAFNQLFNHAAKLSYMTAGQLKCPLIVRAAIGRSWGQGAQHAQGLLSTFAHIPGLQVAMPIFPHDAKGQLITALERPGPTIFIEHRMLYFQKGPVPEGHYTKDTRPRFFPVHDPDITLIGMSHMGIECLRAQKYLETVGIQAEVMLIQDLPLRIDALICDIGQVDHPCLIVENDWLICGVAAEIMAQMVENFKAFKPRVLQRMGFAPCPCPTTPVLEQLFYPNAKTIASKAYDMVNHETWTPQFDLPVEESIFSGPF